MGVGGRSPGKILKNKGGPVSNSINRILQNFVDHELFIRWSKKLGDMSPMSPRNYGPVMSSFCEHKSVPLAVVLSLTTDQGYFCAGRAHAIQRVKLRTRNLFCAVWFWNFFLEWPGCSLTSSYTPEYTKYVLWAPKVTGIVVKYTKYVLGHNHSKYAFRALKERPMTVGAMPKFPATRAYLPQLKTE